MPMVGPFPTPDTSLSDVHNPGFAQRRHGTAPSGGLERQLSDPQAERTGVWRARYPGRKLEVPEGDLSTGLLVFLIGMVAAVLAAAISIARTDLDPIEPRLEERWLVRLVSANPRLAHFVSRRLDRKTAGGLLLTVGFLTVFALAIFVATVFDMVAGEFGLAVFDLGIAEFGATHAGTTTAEVQALFTHLGGNTVITMVTASTAGWGWWRYGNPQVALFMIVVVLGQAALTTGLKWIVARDRPDLEQLAPWSGSSFPSGHTAAAAATYAAVALVLTLRSSWTRRGIAAGAAAFLAIGVAATRALLGVHWFTDVLAGLAVGYGWFLTCAIVFGGRIMRFGEPVDEMAVASDARRS